MGSGAWTAKAFDTYICSTKAMSAADYSVSNLSAQENFVNRSLDPVLDPRNVMRECRDSDEHPNTIPVILALDVTGSMGPAAMAVAKKLNEIMTTLYSTIKDVEFCIMGIGDLAYDRAPIQISQFESDVRIAEQLDKIYFERGGGGNGYESYTAAWYMGLYHTKLDCWNRGRKGIIITLGDEALNPYLPNICEVVGGTEEGVTDTEKLYELAREKFDIYHIAVDDGKTSYYWYKDKIDNSWGKLLKQNLIVSNLDNLPRTITDIIKNYEDDMVAFPDTGIICNETPLNLIDNGSITTNENNEVTW